MAEVPVDKNGKPVLNGDNTKKVIVPSSLPDGEEKKVKKRGIDAYRGS